VIAMTRLTQTWRSFNIRGNALLQNTRLHPPLAPAPDPDHRQLTGTPFGDRLTARLWSTKAEAVSGDSSAS
jgi:hypothetical protein